MSSDLGAPSLIQEGPALEINRPARLHPITECQNHEEAVTVRDDRMGILVPQSRLDFHLFSL